MSPTPDSTFDEPQQVIADLQRQLASRTPTPALFGVSLTVVASLLTKPVEPPVYDPEGADKSKIFTTTAD
jgi:hypothetical protein